MFLKISKFFIYLSFASPLLITRNFLFPFITGKAIFFRAAFELSLLFFILALAFQKNFQFPISNFRFLKRPLVIAVSIFTFLFLLSSALGVNPLNSLFSNYERGEGAFQMLHYFIFFLLLLVLFRDKKQWLNLFKFSVIISLFVSFYALGQFCEAKGICDAGFFLASSSRISGTLGNSSYLAVYLLFHLFFLGIIFFPALGEARPIGRHEKSIKLKIVWASVALFQFIILFNTQTRGVILGLAIALVLWFLLMLGLFIFKKISFQTLRASLFVFICLVLVFGVFYSISAIKPNSFTNRFVNVLDVSYLKNALKDRIWTWQAALSGIKERPVLGWGAENFPIVFDKHYNPKLYGVESWFDRAHSIYFDYAISGGLLLLAAFLSIFVLFYRRLFTLLNQPLFFSLFFILPTTYLIQGLILFDVLPVYLVFFLFLGFFVNFNEPDKNSFGKISDSRKEISFNKNCLKGLVIIFFLVLVVSFYFTAYLPMQRSALIIKGSGAGQQFDFYLSRYAAQKSKEDLNNAFIGLKQGIESFDSAINHRSLIGEQESLLMFHQFLSGIFDSFNRNQGFLGVGDLRIILDFANQTFENKKKNLVGTRPFLLIAIINLRAGLASQENYYFDKAEKYFEEALEKAPTRLEFIYPYLDLAIVRGDKEKAITLLNRAKTLRPDLTDLNQTYLKKYQDRF